MNKATMVWAVYDINLQETIGIWIDKCHAEEFMQENEGPDWWAVMPAEEL